ncbi:aminotransferase class IV [Microbacterium gubbeenense]|uniref:aminotransferase class IV n=1 Tax=Microbacterium gubbeenense TaxID=159896 RepID=UPI000428E4A4|nr:aminotransferase class IV [Microbacterium gubbeenense]
MELIDGLPPSAADMRALAFAGLAHFTTMRVHRGGVRGLARHLDRLVIDGRALFDIALDTDLVRRRIREAIADEPENVIVRVTLFDPSLTLERPGADASPRILVSPRGAPSGSPSPLRVRSTRFGRQSPEIKHTGLFGSLYERRLAQRAGFDDAVFVDAAGRLSEGPTWNLGFVHDGDVIWADGDALQGVTRTLVGGASETVALDDLPRMDAAFASGSGAGIRPIASIDEVTWPTDHPAFDRVRAAYASVPFDEI